MYTINSSISKTTSIFRRSFLIAGVSFLVICILGLITWSILDPAGVLKGINQRDRFDFSTYRKIGSTYLSSTERLMNNLSLFSLILIIVSFVLRIIWAFKINSVSRTFIISAYATYVLSQGIAFGILFTILRAPDILTIFGISGLMFLIFGFFGYWARDLSKMRIFLIGGSIGLMLSTLILLPLTFFVDISKFWLLWNILIVILIAGYIMYDVWSLKKTSQFYNADIMDDDHFFRITAWFGLRLLTDMVILIWTVARIFILRRY